MTARMTTALLLLFATSTAFAQVPATQPAPDFRVVAYLPEYRTQSVNPAILSNLTDLIFFSVTPTPDGGIDAGRLTEAALAKLTEIKRLNPTLRITVAFGGDGRSDAFAPMAADPIRRNRFIAEAARFCQSHGFEGIDYDWEFPRGDAQAKALAALVVETKRAFAPLGLTVTVATAPWDEFDKNLLTAADGLNLMTYFDDARHTSLAVARSDLARVLATGADPAKIRLGIPFYGEKVNDKRLDVAYADIVRQYHPTPDQDDADGISFNGPETVKAKVRFARAHHLAGVMIWEIGQDTPEGTLVRAVREAATGR